MKSAGPVSSSSNTTEPARRWYGWQTFATDGAAVALAVAAVPLGAHAPYEPAEVLGYSAAAAYALGAPIVHLAQHQPVKAAASLGLRVGLPVVTFALLRAGSWRHCPARSESEDVEYCQLQLADVIGPLAAGVAASVIDGALLAWKPVESKRATAWLPLLTFERSKGGTAVAAGVSGVF